MHAALTLGLRHALDAVYAALELEPRIHAVACDAEHDLFIAAQLGLGTAHHLGLPAAPVRVHRVHAVQVGRKQRAFLAACAAANFDIDVLLVVRVLGQKQELELSLKPRDVALGLLELLLRKLIQLFKAVLLEVRGRAFYAISLSAPTARMADERIMQLRGPLLRASRDIAQALGGSTGR